MNVNSSILKPYHKNLLDFSVIRTMNSTDLPAITTIQQRCYGESYREEQRFFAEKLTLFPDGCLVTIINNCCAGYVFSHPWSSDLRVPLNCSMSPLPIAYDCWHIHDCSIDPGFRGKGLGTSLIKQVFTVAQKSNHQRVQLVSVQNSQMYWHRYGFLKCETEPKYDTTSSYGADAVLMSMSF